MVAYSILKSPSFIFGITFLFGQDEWNSFSPANGQTVFAPLPRWRPDDIWKKYLVLEFVLRRWATRHDIFEGDEIAGSQRKVVGRMAQLCTNATGRGTIILNDHLLQREMSFFLKTLLELLM